MRTFLLLACLAFASGEKTYGWADASGGVSGGSGGKSVTVKTGKELNQAICGRSSKSEKLTIYVSGTINHGNTASASGSGCGGGKKDAIELKGVSNLSIIGKSGTLDQIGIHIVQSKNIIIQNLHIKNVKKSNGKTSNGGDAIGMENSNSHIWIDHCTLEASGGEKDGYDGLVDMKKGTKYVTVSYTIFKNSGRGGLVGHNDADSGNGPVTFHHNYYQNMDSRMPLLRKATIHTYNNYFNKINKSAVNSRAGAKARVEKNYFKNTKNPVGTFYTSAKGYWHLIGNVLDGCKWTDAYTPAKDMKSTTSVSVSYSFKADDAKCVPTLVSSTAGANKGLKRSDGSCSSTSSPSPPSESAPSYEPPSSSSSSSSKSSSSKSSSSKSSSSKSSSSKSKKTKKSKSKSKKSSSSSCTGAWGNCIKTGCCRSGYTCKKVNQWYAQCTK